MLLQNAIFEAASNGCDEWENPSFPKWNSLLSSAPLFDKYCSCHGIDRMQCHPAFGEIILPLQLFVDQITFQRRKKKNEQKHYWKQMVEQTDGSLNGQSQIDWRKQTNKLLQRRNEYNYTPKCVFHNPRVAVTRQEKKPFISHTSVDWFGIVWMTKLISLAWTYLCFSNVLFPVEIVCFVFFCVALKRFFWLKEKMFAQIASARKSWSHRSNT